MAAEENFPKDSPFRKLVPSTDDVRRFCEEFRIGGLVAVHGRLGGYLNVSLKVETTTGLYVVRVLSEFATREHIYYARRIISLLREAGIPATTPVATPSDEPFIRWHGRFVTVTRFEEGCSFQRRPGQALASGSMLRRLHDTLAHVAGGPTPEWSDYPSDGVLTEGLRRLRAAHGIPRDQLADAEHLHDAVMDRWHATEVSLPTTVIHGDWHPGNQLYTDGEVSCILDFDFAQRAERLHDVAYALWALLPYMPAGPLVRAFLAGYGELESGEVGLLPVAIARAALFFVCTASFTIHPADELSVQLDRESPLIEWLLSPRGEQDVRGMYLRSVARPAA